MLFFKNIQTGKKGEDIACDYVKKLGYKIIDRNWHYSKNAEIDIIALDKDCIVFIEVKTRKSEINGHPFEAITKNKIDKIITAAYAYLALSPEKYKDYRIDGIAIVGLNNPTIEHIKNIGLY